MSDDTDQLATLTVARDAAEQRATALQAQLDSVLERLRTRDERIAWFEKSGGVAVHTRVFQEIARRERAEAERDTLRQQIEQLAAQWKETGRRVKPLEDAPITAEKRARVTEWMHYVNRANELAALLAAAQGEP